VQIKALTFIKDLKSLQNKVEWEQVGTKMVSKEPFLIAPEGLQFHSRK